MIPSFTNEATQRRWEDQLQMERMNDQRTRAITDVAMRILLNQGLSDQSPETQAIIMQLVGVLQNTVGPLFGINNITPFESFAKGISASRVPVMALDYSTGYAVNRYAGAAHGIGNITMSVAAQLSGSLQRYMQNVNGGLDYSKTYGLNMVTLGQIAGQIAKQRGIHYGDVTSINLGRAGDTEAELLQRVSENAELFGGKDSAEYKKMEKMAHSIGMLGKLYTPDGRDRHTGERASFQELVHMLKDNDKDMSDAEAVSVAQTYLKGGITITRLKQNTVNDIMKGTELAAENVKTLSDIFNTDNFETLQHYAKALRLGSLTDSRNIQNVKKSLREAKADAELSGREIKDVLMERSSIVAALGDVFGGTDYVPAYVVSAIQHVRTNQQNAYDRGTSYRTGDMAAIEVARSFAAHSNDVRGMAVMTALESKGFLEGNEEDKAHWEEIQKTYAEARTVRSKKLTANRALTLARKIAPDLLEDPAFIRTASAENGQSYVDALHEAIIHENINTTVESRLRRMGHKNPRDRITQNSVATLVDIFRGDNAGLEEFINIIKETDPKKLEQVLRSRYSVLQEADLNRLITAGVGLSTVRGTAEFTQRVNVARQMQSQPLIRNSESAEQKAERILTQHTQWLQGKRTGGVRTSNGMLEDVKAAILADGGANADDLINMSIAEEGITKFLETGGIKIGSADSRGRFSEAQVTNFLTNERFLSLVGLKASDEKGKAQLKKQLMSEGGDMFLGDLIKANGGGMALHDGVFYAKAAAAIASTKAYYSKQARDTGVALAAKIFNKDSLKLEKDKDGNTHLKIAKRVNGLTEWKDPNEAFTDTLRSPASFATRQAIYDLANRDTRGMTQGELALHNAAQSAITLEWQNFGSKVYQASGGSIDQSLKAQSDAEKMQALYGGLKEETIARLAHGQLTSIEDLRAVGIVDENGQLTDAAKHSQYITGLVDKGIIKTDGHGTVIGDIDMKALSKNEASNMIKDHLAAPAIDDQKKLLMSVQSIERILSNNEHQANK